jgi:hypothetical protein
MTDTISLFKISKVKLLAFSFLLGSFVPQGALAQDQSKINKGGAGFFYDSERQKYFSNERSTFTIRPVNSKEYLERIEVSVDGKDFQEYKGVLSFTNEGPHQIRFRAVDPVLNWSPIQTFRIYVDKTAPKSQVVWKGPTYYKENTLYLNPQTVLNIVGQDNLSGVSKIFWNKEGGTVSRFPGSISFSKEGQYHYQVHAIDNVGNKEAAYDMKFVVDGVSPKTNAVIEGTFYKKEDKIFVNTGSHIKLNSVDKLSGIQRIEYQINNGLVTTYNRPIILSEYETKLKYRAIDHVGNKEKWSLINVYQDIKPPKIRVRKSGKSFTISGKVYARPGFAFKANINDEGSGIKETLVSMGNAGQYKDTKDKTFTFNTPGETKFHLKVQDNVGNIEETDPYTIVIDNEPPKLSLKSTELLKKKDNFLLSSVPNRIFFDSVDNGAGTDRIEISYDGDKFKTLTAPIELSEWKKQKQTLYYRGVDRLGNVGKTESVNIFVKTRGPKVELYVESDDLPNLPLSAIKSKFGSARNIASKKKKSSSRDEKKKDDE